MSDILAVIGRLRWRRATTMALPHEYCVRGRDGSPEDWFALQAAIKASPVTERWRGRRNRYLYPGDGWKYWDQPPHPLINRMRVEDDLERLRAEGRCGNLPGGRRRAAPRNEARANERRRAGYT